MPATLLKPYATACWALGVGRCSPETSLPAFLFPAFLIENYLRSLVGFRAWSGIIKFGKNGIWGNRDSLRPARQRFHLSAISFFSDSIFCTRACVIMLLFPCPLVKRPEVIAGRIHADGRE
jgi:hypothetical protein